MEDLETCVTDEDQSTVTIPPETAEKSQDSAITLKLSVDPSTVNPCLDSEGPLNTKPSSVDSEVLPNFTELTNSEISQIQPESSVDIESVQSSSHP